MDSLERARELAAEGLDYFERAGDEGDRCYVSAIRAAMRQQRAEAERLSRVCNELGANRQTWVDACQRTEAELAALKARIAEAAEKWRGELIRVPRPPNGGAAKGYNCALTACAAELERLLREDDGRGG